jgi:hypothetical protein
MPPAVLISSDTEIGTRFIRSQVALYMHKKRTMNNVLQAFQHDPHFLFCTILLAAFRRISRTVDSTLAMGSSFMVLSWVTFYPGIPP